MTITISLPAEIESKLRVQAAASSKDIASLILEAVQDKLAVTEVGPVKSYEQWLGEFSAWMRDVASRSSAYPPGFIVDDSRETIYEGRGQ